MRIAATPGIFEENRQASVAGRVIWRIALLFGQRGIAEKGAAGSWGRAGRARTRSGDGEGWGRDRVRVAPVFVRNQRAVAVSGTGRGSPSATQTFGSDCDSRFTKR